MCPEIDVSDTAQRYHIETALPSIIKNPDISMQWVSSDTLVIQAALMTAEDQIKHKHVLTAQPDSKSKFEKLLNKVSDSGHLSQRKKQDLSKTEDGTNGLGDGLTESRLNYILKERKSGCSNGASCCLSESSVTAAGPS